ncbi:MAG: TolC family protein [Acidobacteriota bacterium]|nr:TolC family protein [Blastocatellia bacterium]MDW8238215.1 TolC family protein [Acidobacteriota bacterium]
MKQAGVKRGERVTEVAEIRLGLQERRAWASRGVKAAQKAKFVFEGVYLLLSVEPRTGQLQWNRMKAKMVVLLAELIMVGTVNLTVGQTTQPGLQNQPRFISRDEAVRLALMQASTFKQSQLNEQIVAQDVFQSNKAFLPRVSANPTLIYNSPTVGPIPVGTLRPPSFLGANAITEYQGLVAVSGELDISGRLRANRRRAQFLLQAAKAGTEITRRNLINATDEAYLNLSLATAKRKSAEASLQSAEEFEKLTKLLVEGGEIAPVDLLRAQIQTDNRRDELEQARVNERIAADYLLALLGLDASQEIAVSDLELLIPDRNELERFSLEAVMNRPELQQLHAETKAAQEDAKIAKAELMPRLICSIDIGFISDSLRSGRIGNSTGVRATVGISIPLFDWGASKSRQKQAQFRAQISETSRIFAERQFIAQFNSNMTQAKSAAFRIRSLEENLSKAQKILEVAILRYRAGETQIIEVTDAQTQVIVQRNALLRAIYDYRIAVAQLRFATGQ